MEVKMCNCQAIARKWVKGGGWKPQESCGGSPTWPYEAQSGRCGARFFQTAWEMFKVPAEEKDFFFLTGQFSHVGTMTTLNTVHLVDYTPPVFRCPGSVGQPGALLTANEQTLDATESAESMPGELRRSWWNARSLKLTSIIRPRLVLNNSGLVPRLVSHP